MHPEDALITVTYQYYSQKKIALIGQQIRETNVSKIPNFEKSSNNLIKHLNILFVELKLH
jgi:hypothetical protein